MDKLFQQAVELRKSGKVKEALNIFKELLDDHPYHAEVHYQYAWCCDLLGEESSAVPYYEKAIALGLTDESLKGAMLGLGSTFRTLGKYEQSKKILEQAIDHFPDQIQFQVFYAMTLYNVQEHTKAMNLLLKCITNTTQDEEILAYKNAINFYADKLDQVWD
ncbi:tetratricopeptide repeat protein [Solibacillus sp. CAU 1738]|uniref:tetratricopeptide repeat protein n=1 Tax=Solibacillus sp. CAU 1738 TaxID=3140363 RepID=UPI003260AD16